MSEKSIKPEKPFRSGYIALVGRPNVGKSTLLNYVLKEKIAIVSDKPQTTRTRIMGVKHLKNSQMVFLDTPGIHKPKYKMNQRMVQTALGTLQEVDLIFFMVEATDAHTLLKKGVLPRRGDHYILDWIKGIKTPVFLILNKVDAIQKSKTLPLAKDFSERFPFSEIFPVSALCGTNVSSLLSVAESYLPEKAPIFPDDAVTDQPVRFIAAEQIREKILKYTRQEIPYSVAVFIDEFREEKNQPTRIMATVYVERDSQKGILIGKRGAMLKQVGTEARKELEALLGTKIFMELWVKVQRDWRQNESFLTEMGY